MGERHDKTEGHGNFHTPSDRTGLKVTGTDTHSLAPEVDRLLRLGFHQGLRSAAFFFRGLRLVVLVLLLLLAILVTPFELGVGTDFALASFELAGLEFELDELQSELELELEALELELELLEFEPVLKVELGLLAWLALRVELDCLAVEVEAEVEVELSSYWLEVELELELELDWLEVELEVELELDWLEDELDGEDFAKVAGEARADRPKTTPGGG